MDIMMPRLDGLETTRMLRQNGNDVPILVLTARDAIGDRVDGLDAGADDYMVKPFSLEELLVRLRALTRRSRPEPAENTETLLFDDLTLDTQSREVTRRGRRISLTRTELALLQTFMEHPQGAGTQLAAQRGVGLRLSDHRQLAGGLHRLPATQDGAGR